MVKIFAGATRYLVDEGVRMSDSEVRCEVQRGEAWSCVRAVGTRVVHSCLRLTTAMVRYAMTSANFPTGGSYGL